MRNRRTTGLQVVCVLLITLAGCGAYSQSFTVQYGDAVFRTFLDLLLTNAVNELVSTEPPPDMPPPADPCEDVSCDAGEICVGGACEPQPVDGDPDIGMMFYLDNSCDACHGVDAGGGIGPSLIGSTAEGLFATMSGAAPHAGGAVDGVTPQDAADLSAWLDSL